MSVPTSSAWTISRVLLLRRHIKELNSRLTLGQLPFSRLCTLGAIEFEIHSTAWVNVDAALYNVDTALVGALYCNRALSSPTGQTKHVRRFNSLERITAGLQRAILAISKLHARTRRLSQKLTLVIPILDEYSFKLQHLARKIQEQNSR
ncbi:hypothetical protein R3P38DRAFT_3375293 [Favolaschia claudopus]|uniref:Uncharacterized protein n=1 Tax=Favolaschia claudopus TaxID=2862362 RepID=A0AAV9ZJ30_9AGAR